MSNKVDRMWNIKLTRLICFKCAQHRDIELAQLILKMSFLFICWILHILPTAPVNWAGQSWISYKNVWYWYSCLFNTNKIELWLGGKKKFTPVVFNLYAFNSFILCYITSQFFQLYFSVFLRRCSFSLGTSVEVARPHSERRNNFLFLNLFCILSSASSYRFVLLVFVSDDLLATFALYSAGIKPCAVVLHYWSFSTSLHPWGTRHRHGDNLLRYEPLLGITRCFSLTQPIDIFRYRMTFYTIQWRQLSWYLKISRGQFWACLSANHSSFME